MDGQRLASALGWFSIALGAAEVAAPKKLSRALGVRGHKRLVRAFGLREIAAGVGILAQRRPAQRAKWLWARVAGDALDLGALFAALPKSSKRGRVVAAIANVAAVTALDIVAAVQLTKSSPVQGGA